MNTRLPAVVIAPPEFGVPVGLTPLAVSASNSPSGTRHATSPVFALTATSSPQGGALQLHMFSLFQNRLNGAGVLLYAGGAGLAPSAGSAGGAPRRPPPGC